MPQLNIATFVTQYFWLIVVLGILYYHTVTNNKLAEIVKMRRRAGK